MIFYKYTLRIYSTNILYISIKDIVHALIMYRIEMICNAFKKSRKFYFHDNENIKYLIPKK